MDVMGQLEKRPGCDVLLVILLNPSLLLSIAILDAAVIPSGSSSKYLGSS